MRVRGTRLGMRYKIANVMTTIYEGAPAREADETRANAALIAAAPDLLDFAALVLRGIQSGHVKAMPFLDFSDPNAESLPMRTIGDAAREVIAKATGEKA